MAPKINFYRADLRELRFLLFEQFKLDEIMGKAPYDNWGRGEVETVLAEAYAWVCKVIGPINGSGDAEGCRLENGQVYAPSGFKEAWKALYQAGWTTLSTEEKFGGQAGPFTLHALVEELMCGANAAFNMYPALTHGAAELLVNFGTPAQIDRYAAKMLSGEWAGTMCLTEAQAGSDVGSVATKAVPLGGGNYKIKGTKIFISGGDHDITDNIVHMVLARTEEAPAGTKGLSLFIVPKKRSDGTANDVTVSGLEHKMGIKSSATCALTFGDNDGCIGELVGTEEQKGIAQMFFLMNIARIGVGIQSLGVANAAYLSALAYAKDRKQGSNIKQWKDATANRVPIIEHADVRRMLLDMKAKVEGIRALAIKLTMHTDRAHADPGNADYHNGQVDLLVPLLKAYASDQAFQICTNAIQVYGGAGFLKDWPVEQYARDAKIFSIYEGTNHIQALDLVGRKLGQKGGANVQALAKDIGGFVAAHREHPVFKDAVVALGSAMEALTQSAMRFLGWFTGGKMELVPLAANRFLEMMAETTIGWLLLEGAIIAERSAAALPADHPDRNFYAGKKFAALHFASNALSTVPVRAQLIGKEERSPLDIPEAAFATV